VVAAVRSDERCPDAVSALWKDREAVRLDLQPLSEAEVTVLLEAVLPGGPVDGRLASWVVARKLGVPLVTHGIIHRLQPPAEDGIAPLVGRLAKLAGVEPPRDHDDLLARAYLDIVPPSLRCPWEHDQPLAHPTRPSSFDGPPQPEPLAWLDALGRTRPLVYVTLGNIFTQFPSLWRVVLAARTELDVDGLVDHRRHRPR
jgi:UDP:flavonoid glycosyltransferase YjiC (YdhE family)